VRNAFAAEKFSTMRIQTRCSRSASGVVKDRCARPALTNIKRSTLKMDKAQIEVCKFMAALNDLSISMRGVPAQAMGMRAQRTMASHPSVIQQKTQTIVTFDEPKLRDAELSVKLLDEECKETCNAIRRGDLVEAVDGLGDQLVIILGCGVRWGVDLQRVFDVVMAANWKKFAPGATFRADGKFVKPPDFEEPNIAKELRNQGWKGDE
jgi:hypothetical protein